MNIVPCRLSTCLRAISCFVAVAGAQGDDDGVTAPCAARLVWVPEPLCLGPGFGAASALPPR
jgi:hypothetical protein